jgi:NAD(P)-dependent dehydrogenase (short-subunit alcohol dehydrogenase family)
MAGDNGPADATAGDDGQRDLAGRVALVTGGGSGIGEAVGRRLAAEGCRVVVADIAGDAAERVAREIGGRPVTLDVGDAAAWAEAVDAVVAAEGGLDIAHLNAGVTTQQGDIVALTDQQYRRIMGANVDGVVFGTRAVAGAMAAAGRGGAIVATASLAGIIAFAPDPIYTLTKHAVVGFVRSVAASLEARDITVNCICPGVVATPLVGPALDRLAEAGIDVIPPEDIADAVVTVVRTGRTGEAWTCIHGRDPEPWTFATPDLRRRQRPGAGTLPSSA